MMLGQASGAGGWLLGLRREHCSFSGADGGGARPESTSLVEDGFVGPRGHQADG